MVTGLYVQIGLFNVIVLAILYIRVYGDRKKFFDCKLFCRFVAVTIFVSIMDVIGWVLDGDPLFGMLWITYLIDGLDLLGSAVTCWICLQYVQYIAVDDEKIYRKNFGRNSMILLGQIVMTGVNGFNGMLFYIDSDGVYHRGDIFALYGGLCILHLIIAALISLKAERRVTDAAKKRELIQLMFILLLPILATICQTLIYGQVFIWTCATLILLLFYMIIQNKRIEEEKSNLIVSVKDDLLYSLIELVPGGMFRYRDDEEEQIDFISHNMLELLGYEEQEFRDKYQNRFSLMVYEEDRERVIREIYAQMEVGDFDTCQYRIETKSGELRWFSDLGHRTTDENGVLWFYVILTDITDQMRHDEEIRKNEKLKLKLQSAEETAKARSEFLSRMSHDLRTPLNGIIGVTYVAENELDSLEDIKLNLSRIRNSGKFMLNLVNDILDMTQVEAGKITLKPTPYTQMEFIDEIKTMFNPLCDEKHIKFNINTGEREKNVLVDALRLQQIFFNLLSNAVKFTPEGGEITYEVVERQVNGSIENVTFKVSDTGIGMSPEFQTTMYDSFSRENRNESKGAGLGLPIVKNLVTLMNGTIECESEIGRGTTFIVKLPLTLTEENPAIAEDNKLGDGNLDGMKILLAEDNDLNAMIAIKLMKNRGALVDWEKDGKATLEKFQSSTDNYYDVIVMDIRMPVMDGLEATKRIRELPRSDASAVAIVAMSANAFASDREKSKLAGMNGHLAKPIEPELMYQTLSQFRK